MTHPLEPTATLEDACAVLRRRESGSYWLHLAYPTDTSRPHGFSDRYQRACLYCRLGLAHTVAAHRAEVVACRPIGGIKPAIP